MTLFVADPDAPRKFVDALDARKRETGLEFKTDIFSRERLAGYDPALMGGSTVLVVGAGALGQNIAMNLALAGIGEIRIVDRDQFENHNRTRSPAYPLPEEQALYGLDKARSVAAKLRRLMTAPQPVMRYANNWIQELGDGAFRGVSVVVSCVDSQLARAYLSDKSRLHGLHFVEGGFEAEHLTLTSFPHTSNGDSQSVPCWRCLHPEVRGSYGCRDYALRAGAAGIIPAIQNGAAVLAGLQAEAAILLLHGQATSARSLALNVRTWDCETMNLARTSECPGVHCPPYAEVIPLRTTSDQSVATLLDELGERLGGDARLRLSIRRYAKLISSVPCSGCGRRTMANCPEWRWMMDPHCVECGGKHPRALGLSANSADTYPELTLRSKPEILKATCREIGLMPLSVVEAVRANAPSPFYEDDFSACAFELPGTLDELFESGETK